MTPESDRRTPPPRTSPGARKRDRQAPPATPLSSPDTPAGATTPASAGGAGNGTVPPPGRDQRGRFVTGNQRGPGNPFARRVAGLRQVLLDTVTDDDLR